MEDRAVEATKKKRRQSNWLANPIDKKVTDKQVEDRQIGRNRPIIRPCNVLNSGLRTLR